MDANDFAFAEEVTVKGADAKASTKRPDIVLYINGLTNNANEPAAESGSGWWGRLKDAF